MTLHKRLETGLKVRGLILLREIYYALSSMNGMVKEIGVVKKEKSKIKHLLRTATHQDSDTIRLMNNEAIFMGKGQTTLYGYPKI